MRLLLSLIFDFDVIIESLLAFILDPIIDRNKGFEEWLFKRAFARANKRADREKAKSKGASEWEQ